MGKGGSSEGCLKWGGGKWGSSRNHSKNILKQGVGKGKSCSKGGGGFEGVTTPAPWKILIIHQTMDVRITLHCLLATSCLVSISTG